MREQWNACLLSQVLDQQAQTGRSHLEAQQPGAQRAVGGRVRVAVCDDDGTAQVELGALVGALHEEE